MTDLLTKTENITDEEALDILCKSKDNPSLYQKQINSLREEYEQAEIDQIQQQQYQQQQYQQQIYNKYSDDVSNAIMNLKELGVPYVLAKAKNRKYGDIMLKIGADKIHRQLFQLHIQIRGIRCSPGRKLRV